MSFNRIRLQFLDALLMTTGGLFLVLFFLRSNKIKDQVEAWSRKRTGRLEADGVERKL
ncbi:hypothetical protein [Paenibacillus sp. 1P07SE]|uniref:hypothetical protein n=1 Tax=Paenibacillus sp. 1P07SE TaxID=3132209 RepID=UPI0039A532FB